MIKKLYNNCFKIMCLIFAMCLCVLGICYTYKAMIKNNAQSEKKIISVQKYVSQMKVENGAVIEQTFITNEPLKSFYIRFFLLDSGHDYEDGVSVELVDDSNG